MSTNWLVGRTSGWTSENTGGGGVGVGVEGVRTCANVPVCVHSIEDTAHTPCFHISSVTQTTQIQWPH